MKIITYIFIILCISSGVTLAETDPTSKSDAVKSKTVLLTQPVNQQKLNVVTANLSEYEKYQQNKILHSQQLMIRKQKKEEHQAIQRKLATKKIMARSKSNKPIK